MKHGFTIRSSFLAYLSKNNEYINIILGTGSIARDLQTKLRLLGLNAPYLVGDRDEEAIGIRHYKCIAEIDDPAQYRFISCFDTDEMTLIGPLQSAVLKLLGTVTPNHPQFIRLTSIQVVHDGFETVNDIFSLTTGLSKGRPYACYSDGNDDVNAFKIHIWGGSSCRCISSSAQYMWPELLYRQLRDAGFSSAVYSWGQSLNSFADCLLRFLRDKSSHKSDLVIFYSHPGDLDSLRFKNKNMLATRSNEGINTLLRFMRSDNMRETLGDISDGIDHDADLVSIWVERHRVMCALSRLFNFKFWNCLLPSPFMLPKEQAEKLSGVSPGYLARRRKMRDDAVTAARRYGKVIDVSEVVAVEDDIISFYLDNSHLTNEGNELVAKRFASEILEEFREHMM